MRKLIVAVVILAVAASPVALTAQTAQQRRPDVIWVPTADVAVEAMLRLAQVGPDDVVYDLGCGDGKIVIAAAKLGARAIGIDIDPDRVRDAKLNVRLAGVEDRALIIEGDIFDPNLTFDDATVVTLYLLESLNKKLMPRLQQLRPGTRIVSNTFTMGSDWPHDKTEQAGYNQIYLWFIR
jgi:cyclopropane fatty-acyl-phospholipid synthase-like methyltransferase